MVIFSDYFNVTWNETRDKRIPKFKVSTLEKKQDLPNNEREVKSHSQQINH